MSGLQCPAIFKDSKKKIDTRINEFLLITFYLFLFELLTMCNIL